MEERSLSYFVSDVHLGLKVNDPAGREARFVRFLKSIPKERCRALYLLGDIWDFWYEYRDVVPKGYVRVFSALIDLMDSGVKVYFSGQPRYLVFPLFRGTWNQDSPAAVCHRDRRKDILPRSW